MDLIELSPSEATLLALIPTGSRNRVTTSHLRDAFFLRRKRRVNERVIITGLLRSLEKKLEASGSKMVIARTELSGPHPIEVWMEPRSKR